MSEQSTSRSCVRPPARPVARAAALLTLLVLTAPADAGMLDAESCRRIKADYDTLASSGIRGMMAKGPEWAKANLTKERMDQIRRYLSLEEDVRFRCPLGKARPELEAAESEAGAATPLQPGEVAPGAASTPPAQPAAAKPARKTKPASVQQPAAATTDPASGTGASPQAKPKAAAKAAATPPKAAAAKPRPAAAKSQPPEQGDAQASDIGAVPAEPARKSPR